MHFVVDDVTGYSEVDGVYYFVIAIVFIAIKIRRLSTVACDSQCLSLCVDEQELLT